MERGLRDLRGFRFGAANGADSCAGSGVFHVVGRSARAWSIERRFGDRGRPGRGRLSDVHALIRECIRSLSARWFVKVESYSCIGDRTNVPTRMCGICPVDSSRPASQNWARSRENCTKNSACR